MYVAGLHAIPPKAHDAKTSEEPNGPTRSLIATAEQEDYEQHRNRDSERSELATEICNELTVHTQLEEQVFHPAAREALEESDLVDEAVIEHQVAKELVEKIRQSRPHDEEYCALVTVLGEYVNHHIEEEQKELFPQMTKTELDFEALAEEMRQKKQELMSELGLAEGEQMPMEGPMIRQQRGQASRSRSTNR